ncbi:hypothetical protein [Streptomyces sp. PA5.6]|uniref:hypothetical protein n=1 Tax=Streptomyces sp. PA5.6 TaxID=3035651 RepID=UPI003904CC49
MTVSGKGDKNSERVKLAGDYRIVWKVSNNVQLGSPTNFIASLRSAGDGFTYEDIANVIKASATGDTNV